MSGAYDPTDFSVENVEALISAVHENTTDAELENFEYELRAIQRFINSMLYVVGDRLVEMESEDEDSEGEEEGGDEDE